MSRNLIQEKNIFYTSAVIKITFYLALPIRPLKQTKRDENDTSVLIGIDLLKTFFSFRLKSSKKMNSFDMRISLLIILFKLQYLDPEIVML